jgi:putative ABC transport system permease protein
MSRLFFPRLAAANIRKNGRFYFPYLLTCIGTVAMFYIMCAITFDEGIKKMPGADSLSYILKLGCIVIGVFSFIFLFYTNSFLVKRRKKELGLYNILGMEKRHIAKMMFFETAIVAFAGITGGISAGVLLHKLITLCLFKLIDFSVPVGFSLSGIGMAYSLLLFCSIFVLTLLFNFMQIKLANPIELLRGGNVGEREPKTKRLLTFAGAACLGAGYFIAQTIESPLEALIYFFLAVLLVIAGTYCLFTAGSIFVLKLVRNNKRYYYQAKHFTSVSGMLYRMKQNAVGLANICVLSTMVLVMVSTTVSLYAGVEDALNYRYKSDIQVTADYTSADANRDSLMSGIENAVKAQNRNISNLKDYSHLSFTANRSGDALVLDTGNSYSYSSSLFVFLTAEEYARLSGAELLKLEGNEALVYSTGEPAGSSIMLQDQVYRVKAQLDSFPTVDEYSEDLMNVHFVVVSGDEALNRIYETQKSAYGKYASSMSYEVSFDIDGTDKEKIDCAEAVQNALDSGKVRGFDSIYLESKQMSAGEFYALYGGFLFLGIFLGLLFLMATVLIMYYKQISEGYDDKERFEIMQKVGMSREEIRKTISSQVLLVFFMPLAAACVHIAFAFKIITKLLAVMNLTNVSLFAWCTAPTVLVFGAIYGIVYALTARVYYRIVS